MKRVTRKRRQALIWVKLNPNNWLVKKEVNGELLIKHKMTGNERKIPL